MTKLTNKEKQDLDEFLGYAVKEGLYDPDDAQEMTWDDKLDYFNKSEVVSND